MEPTAYSYIEQGGVANTRTQVEEELTLEEIADRYSTPVKLNVTSIAYHNATKRQRSEHKKALNYFVGGVLQGRRHDTSVKKRTLLTLDVEQGDNDDTPPPQPDSVAARLEDLGGEGWIYTSLSHTPRSPRYRVVLPLGKPLTGDTEEMQSALEASTRAAAKKLGIEAWTKPESWVLSQPMYLPAVLKGGAFWQHYSSGKRWAVVRRSVQSEPREVGSKVPADIPDERPDHVLNAIKAAGLYLRANTKHKGMHFITCPFHELHGAENDTQTVYYEAHFDGNPRAAVKCFDTEPDEDGQPHLTYTTLVRWLVDNEYMTKAEQDKAGVLEDPDRFDQLADIGLLLERPTQERQWAIERLAPVGKVTVLAGPGGVSKSMLMLHLLCYASMGQKWAQFKTAEALRSLYVSYEDDTLELHKRISSLASALREQDEGTFDILHDVNGSIRKNMRVYAADDNAASWLLLHKPERFGPAERTERVQWLVDYLKEKGIKLLCLDPAVYTHQLEENNIADMATYMQTLTAIAKNADCAVVVLHHMSKAGAWQSLDDMNQGSLRGASSFADNARSVAVVVSMPMKDAPLYGLPADRETVSRYVVVQHVKHNYSAPLPTQVFERRGALLLPRPDIQKLDSVQMAEAKQKKALEEHEARMMALALPVLQFLYDAGDFITTTQLAMGAHIHKRRIGEVVEELANRDWLELEDGPRGSTQIRITRSGKTELFRLQKAHDGA